MSTKRIVALAVALPLLFVGLWLIVHAILDMSALPGATHSILVEWIVVGVPLTWLGLRLLRYAVRREQTRGPSTQTA